VTPYVYGRGGNERTGQHESGGGLQAEFDVLGQRRTIVGVNLLRGTSTKEERRLVGPYVRLGFGRWGILAEHDITDRTVGTVAFRQQTSYGQLFWAVREWLVPSLIVERLYVNKPYRERLSAAKIELAARLTPQISASAGPRIQRDENTGRIQKSVVFQVTVKTVHYLTLAAVLPSCWRGRSAWWVRRTSTCSAGGGRAVASWPCGGRCRDPVNRLVFYFGSVNQMRR
jgi:hypothetical protein